MSGRLKDQIALPALAVIAAIITKKLIFVHGASEAAEPTGGEIADEAGAEP
jgi:hypothetical protein